MYGPPAAGPAAPPMMPPIGPAGGPVGGDPQSLLLQQLMAAQQPPQVTLDLPTLIAMMSGQAMPPGVGGPVGPGGPDIAGDDAAALPPAGPPAAIPGDMPPAGPADLMSGPEGVGANVEPLGSRMDKAMKAKPEKKKGGQGKK